MPRSLPLAGDADTIALYVIRSTEEGCSVGAIRLDLAAILTTYLLAVVSLDLRNAGDIVQKPGSRQGGAPAGPMP